MNILDITPADIERLKENKIVFGLLPERDREILRCVDTGNVERYCHSGFYRCKKGGSFDPCAVYRIIAGYQPLSPSEEDIIAYLKASEVPPRQWLPVVQEWAKRHEGELVWEYQTADRKGWIKTRFIAIPNGDLCAYVPHRLRADYGRKENQRKGGRMKEYDYPTEEELERIKAWEPSDIKGLLSFIKSIWWHPDWGFKLQENCLELHTGGWSGNEMIIDELEKTIFWFMFWQKSERGGHYYFQFEENYVLYEK